jgi:hypothetical protein
MNQQKYNKLQFKFTNEEFKQHFNKYNLDDSDAQIQNIQQNIINNRQYIPLKKCDYIYRVVSWEELINFIAGKTLINNHYIGFSFTKVLLSTRQFIRGGSYYILTFNRQILQNNFQLIDIIPSLNWLKYNIDIVYNICNNIDNYYQELLLEKYNIHENSNENALEILLKLKDKTIITDIFRMIVEEQECLLLGDYYFIPGCLVNIQGRNRTEDELEKLYNFILENKDKLNLDL